MGQNICSEVNCCKSIIYQDSIGDKEQYKQTNKDLSAQTSRVNERVQDYQPPIKEQSIEVSPTQSIDITEGWSQSLMPDLLHDLSEIRNKMLDEKTPKEIYLSIDEVWKNEMRLLEKPMNYYYDKIDENKYTRNRQDNSKFQILFRQHFPKFGIFFFEITLISYEPKNGCEFVFGVVDYLQAAKKPHCKGAEFEESYLFKISKNFGQKQMEIQRINILLKVEINRETNKINFYVNGQQAESKDLKPGITDQTISLAPYIQTQGLGITFGWRQSPTSRSATYKMSTIIQEESSIYVTH